MTNVDGNGRLEAIEVSRNQRLIEIESIKKEELIRIASKYQTSDQVGYVLNRIAIAVLISFYGMIILNDLIGLFKHFKPAKKSISKKPTEKKKKKEDAPKSLNKIDAYDERFESIEISLYKSLFKNKTSKRVTFNV